MRAASRIAPDVELKTIAKSTAGFTGADLENLLNEAALLAARRSLKAITMTEIEEATIKVVVGTEKKSRVMTDKEKKLTAYHEGGHAVVTYYLHHAGSGPSDFHHPARYGGRLYHAACRRRTVPTARKGNEGGSGGPSGRPCGRSPDIGRYLYGRFQRY